MAQHLEGAKLQQLDRFEEFVRIISRLYKQIQKIKNLEMRELGLKGPQVMSLYYLSRHEQGLTAAQLCRLIAVDKAAVSRVLAQLQEQGLIAYTAAGRRYRTLAVLTESGHRVAAQICILISDMVFQADAGVTETTREAMYTTLHRIAENLETLAPVSAEPADFEQTGEKR